MSDKPTRIQLTIAIIGLIGVLGAALIANWDKIFGSRPNTSGANVNTTPAPTATLAVSATKTVPDGCFSAFAQGVRRVVPIEAGSYDVQILASDESKEQPFILRLEKNRQLIGAVKLEFHANGRIFSIHNVIDAQCQQVDDYRIPNYGAKSTVPSGYEIEMPSLAGGYAVRCDYEHGVITAKFYAL
jgi:hypothetical protein